MFNHYSVMLNESIEYLNIQSDGTYLDMTLGGAGHSTEILTKLDQGKLISFDQDQLAIDHAKTIQNEYSNFYVCKDNFVNFQKHLEELGVDKIDGIIFDLGLSSMQIDEVERGFSYMNEAVLDMRMDKSAIIDAKYIVNNYSLTDLVTVFQKYGEEKFAVPIAKVIVAQREVQTIETTIELVELIKKGIGQKHLNKMNGHPAKKVFQALRIEVNNELNVFEKALVACYDLLNSNGRIVVISFHSLEDRICKYYFNKWVNYPNEIKDLPVIPKEYEPKYRKITKKPLLPTEIELSENSRSKSAKMRVLEKV